MSCFVTRSLCAIALTALSGCAIAPKPYSAPQFAQLAAGNVAHIANAQKPLTKPVDVYEAMARALKYNLDYQVEAMQTSLRAAELNLSHYSLLPNAVASSGYLGRNNAQASSSFNVLTNTPNFSASTSQDQRSAVADLQFSWNILDFGLSYVRANQAADRVLIGVEMQRKVKHRLLENVRTAYWRTMSYEQLMKGLQVLEQRTEAAIANSRALGKSRETSLATILTFERELTEVKRCIRELQRDLVDSREQLASLMGLAPGTEFQLLANNRPQLPRQLSMTLDGMLESAVRDRAEIREIAYQQRISTREAHAALLDLLPGLHAYTTPSWDTNSFLLNSNWVGWGAKASWSLLKLVQYPAKRSVIRAQDDLLTARALAATMAVMTQVHVSRIRYHHFLRELQAVDEHRSVQSRLMTQIRIEARAGRVSEQVLLREELNTLVAQAKYGIAYASLQSAHANVFASIGRDTYGIDDASLSVEMIADCLRKSELESERPTAAMAQMQLRK